MRALSPIVLSALLLACACTTMDAAMNDQRFATVDVGMTADEVQAAFGTPPKTMPFPLSSRVAWEYMGTDTWGYMVEYSVTFDSTQRVVSKTARRINDGGNMGGH